MGFKHWPDKDPDAVLDYGIEWGEFLLLPVADTIAVSDWLMPTTPDTALIKSLDSWNDTITTIWLQGGTVGKTYKVTNRITTVAGRVIDMTVKIRIKEE